jgi:hypothetical protein
MGTTLHSRKHSTAAWLVNEIGLRAFSVCAFCVLQELGVERGASLARGAPTSIRIRRGFACPRCGRLAAFCSAVDGFRAGPMVPMSAPARSGRTPPSRSRASPPASCPLERGAPVKSFHVGVFPHEQD